LAPRPCPRPRPRLTQIVPSAQTALTALTAGRVRSRTTALAIVPPHRRRDSTRTWGNRTWGLAALNLRARRLGRYRGQACTLNHGGPQLKSEPRISTRAKGWTQQREGGVRLGSLGTGSALSFESLALRGANGKTCVPRRVRCAMHPPGSPFLGAISLTIQTQQITRWRL